jgi:hypothetical protein
MYTQPRARGGGMSAGFPLSWETWAAGVAEAYRLKKELEVLFNDERKTHQRVKDITERYFPSGRKRPGAKRRRERIESVGAAVVSLVLKPEDTEWQPDLEGARREIDNVDWRSETGIDA